jgi:hypothetical protein
MSGLVSGIYSSFLRGLMLQFSMEGSFKFISTYVYILIVVPGAVLQLKLVNHAMEVYNQAEIGPIYSSALIIFQMLSGGIILDEFSIYQTRELITLVGFSLICILGIYVLAKKPYFPCFENTDVNMRKN